MPVRLCHLTIVWSLEVSKIVAVLTPAQSIRFDPLRMSVYQLDHAPTASFTQKLQTYDLCRYCGYGDVDDSTCHNRQRSI